MRRSYGITIGLLVLISCSTSFVYATTEEAVAPKRQKWTFSGPFGQYDSAQLQRGFKVYREVCSSCHSLNLVSFRNLAQKGGPELSEEQVKELAASYKIKDGPNETGEMFERPGRLSDFIPSPFPNEEAAKYANGGSYPPDMSVLAKARSYSRPFPYFLTDMLTQYQEHGPDYIVGILTGYDDKEHPDLSPGIYYNKIMPGHKIAMAMPLADNQIEYQDHTAQTVDQYAQDIAAFLMWTAEPHLNDRKKLAFNSFLFLITLTGLLFFTKKRIWSKLKNK